MDLEKQILSDVTVHMKYSRFDKLRNRRENWSEVMHRNMVMHIKRYPELANEIREVYEFAKRREVLPSMRSAQFAGKPIEITPSRIFNCSYVAADDHRVFSEIMFLLLGGTGCGYSVQSHHVEKLPEITRPNPSRTRRYLIGDSIEGWADAIKVLMKSYFFGGSTIRFDYSDIRKKGSELITSGGKAPGPEPLKFCIEQITALLDKKETNSKLTPLEVHDIICYIADAVLAGGIRRAALISLFSATDEQMIVAKSNWKVGSWSFAYSDGPVNEVGETGQVQQVHEDPVTGEKYYDLIVENVEQPGYEPYSGPVYWISEKDLQRLRDDGTLPWYTIHPQRGRANNSIILLRHRLTKKYFKKLWKQIELSGSGEPGIYLTNDKELGTNPCVTADTWVLTSEGPRQVSDLLDNPFTAIVDGKPYQSTAFWSTGIKDVYSLETSRGYSLKLTGNHEVKIKEGDSFRWVAVEDLEPGDSVCIGKHTELESWKGRGTFGEGWLVGSVLGDGCHNPEKYQSLVRYWGKSADEMAEYAHGLIKDLPFENRSDFNGPQERNKTNDSIDVQCQALTQLCNYYLTHDKEVTTAIEETSSEFHRGFLQGLFDADGSVQGTAQKGISVRLSQSNTETLQLAQRMLGRLGIASTLYRERHPAGYRSMPDGKGGSREYWCEATHELVVSRENINRFEEMISFREPEKRAKLEVLLSERVRAPYSDKWTTEAVSITLAGREEVFDCTVDEVHEFDANGLQVHNCGEISLKSCGFCNLCEINASDISSQEELEARVKAAAFLGTLQASYTDFHYLRAIWQRNAEKEALLGISFTGIASGCLDDLDLEKAAEVAKEENARVAKLLGINPAARLNCVKPSGTTSLVVGSSSGIHGWHAPYYIRRLRVGKNEAIYRYLAEKLPELVKDEYFRPHDTAVIEIPQKAPEGAAFRSEGPIALLERVARFSNEWVKPGHRSGDNTHNVSATISVKEDEWEEVGEWMWENRAVYNGLSVLPYDGGTYKQTPFEEITKEKYEELIGLLHEIDLDQVIEESDNTDLKGEVACGPSGCDVI